MQPENDPLAVRRFWDRYIAAVRSKGVSEPFDRWHVIRAEAFIKQLGNRRLVELEAEDISRYLTKPGRTPSL